MEEKMEKLSQFKKLFFNPVDNKVYDKFALFWADHRHQNC